MQQHRRPRHEMPDFVRRALAERGLADAYEQRPPYQRNDYIGWIARAKREATRQKRLAQMLDELERGDRYMNMAYRAKRPPSSQRTPTRGAMQYADVMTRLRSLANADNVAGMARFGINPANTLGVSIPTLRKLAREAGRDHALALRLWRSGVHEARILAGMVDDPARVTSAQMERWALDFDSWDVCDQVCSNLFDRTPFAWEKATAWARRDEEYVRRAGFTLMACLAVHDKSAPDARFEPFFALIVAGATDERNYVKKAVNWALRQTGKRNAALRTRAIAVAERVRRLDSRAARWVASDALRELRAREAI